MKQDNSTPGPWELQGPKIQEDLGGQTYWAIKPNPYKSKAYAFKVVGFYYPYSGLTEDEQLANAELMASAPELVTHKEELKSALEDVLKEYTTCLKQISELLKMNYSENNVVISAKQVIAKHSK